MHRPPLTVLFDRGVAVTMLSHVKRASFGFAACLLVWGATAVSSAQMPMDNGAGAMQNMVPGGAMQPGMMPGQQGMYPGNFNFQSGPSQTGYPAEYAGSDYGGGYPADGGGYGCPPPRRRMIDRFRGNYDDECPPLLGPVSSTGGCFFLRGEVLLWRRTNAYNNVPFVAANTAPVTTRLSSQDLRYFNEFGQRIDTGYEFNDAAKVLFSFINMQNWNATNTVTGANNLFLAGLSSQNSSNFYGASSMTAQNRTMLKSYEANYLNATIFDRLSLLGGFRYVDLIDRTAIISTRTSGAANFQGTSDYILRTTNRLLGGQVGAQLRFDYDLWNLELLGRSGLYDNMMAFTTFFGDNNNTVSINPQAAPATRHSLAAVNDINVSFGRRLSNHVAFRAGYNALCINNVDLAPDQFDPTLNHTNQTQVFSGGDMFVYGTNIGIELKF